MALIPAAQIQVQYNQGGADLIALIVLRNVQTGDTVDIASIGISPTFVFIRYAIVMSFTARQASLATIAGTVITMPSGLPANSTVYLTIGGC